MFVGGPKDIALMTALWLAIICAGFLPKSEMAGLVKVGMDVLLVLWLTKRCVALLGWEQAKRLLALPLAFLVLRGVAGVLWPRFFW